VRYLSWIISIPIALLAISFAVSNREAIDLTVWPLPFVLAAPVYLLVLLTLVLGFIVGGLVAWGGQHHHRREARRSRERIRQLTAELQTYREQEAKREEERRRAAEAARVEAAARAGDEAARAERPAITGP
jgi:uncharacterized integral membrane protein